MKKALEVKQNLDLFSTKEKIQFCHALYLMGPEAKEIVLE